MTIRTQVVQALCVAISGTRGLRYQGEKRLPGRGVFDNTETAVAQYGKILATLEVAVESFINAKTQDEGELLDTELAAIQVAVLNDQSLENLTETVFYTGSQYLYSENGSSIVGLSANFSISYRASSANPSLN